jgi:hypothetical protein
MEIVKMTSEQFVEFMRNLKGHQFVNVMSMTEPQMNDNPFKGRVQKFAIAQMHTNCDYETAVNNELKREGKEPIFESGKLPWGEWVDEGMRNKVITHKGNYYLRTYTVRKRLPHTRYLVDGRQATKEEYNAFAPYLVEDSTSKKQKTCGLADADQVKPKNYKFSSILCISINHTRIVIEG